MTKPTYNTKEAHWYCLHSKAKCEEKVRRQLEQENLESYCPRIRFQKNTIRGQVWFNEALFPCYLFAKFNLIEKRRLINSLSGLNRIVSFGSNVPDITAESMQCLQRLVGEKELIVMDNTMAKGSKVVVSEGPLQGLLAVVTEVMPSSKRVEVLLDFLGQQTSARLSQEKVLKLENPRKEIEVG